MVSYVPAQGTRVFPQPQAPDPESRRSRNLHPEPLQGSSANVARFLKAPTSFVCRAGPGRRMLPFSDTRQASTPSDLSVSSLKCCLKEV